MIKNNCQHEWEKQANASRKMDVGTTLSTLMCKKCSTEMTASEVFSLEALGNQTRALKNQTKLAKHQLGFQKLLSILAFIVSITAVIVALLK